MSYLICNLDKQQYLDPSAFNDDGRSLGRLTSTGDGVLQAQAVLTSLGQGHVYNDINRIAYATEGERFEKHLFEKIVVEEANIHHDHNAQELPAGETTQLRIFVPSCSGAWAGDRIVTASSTDTSQQFVSPEQLDAYEKKWQNNPVREIYQGDKVRDTNLYHVAKELYKDISMTTRAGIYRFDQGKTGTHRLKVTYEKFLSDRLLTQFEGAAARSGKTAYDLTWMSVDDLIKFIGSFRKAGDASRARRWMLKQHLLDWQSEILNSVEIYRRNDKPTVAWEVIDQILKDYEIPTRGSGEKRKWIFPPVLPSRKYLRAAIEAEFKDSGFELPQQVTDREADAVSEALGVATRRRVIDIDGS